MKNNLLVRKIIEFLGDFVVVNIGFRIAIFVIGLIFLLIALWGVNIVININKIQPNNTISDWKYEGWEYKTESNILLIGTDRQENGDEYVDFLMLIRIDKEKEELFALNINTKFAPYYLSENENVIFRNILVVEEKINGLEGIGLLIDRVEYFTAMRVDGYVKLSKQDFTEVFRIWGDLGINAQSDVQDPDLGFDIKQGVNNVSISNFIDFVAAEKSGENDRQSRQLSAFNSLFLELNMRNLIFKFPTFVQNFNNYVESNLSGEDFWNIYKTVALNKDLEVKYGYIKSHPGYVVNTWYGEIWRPIYENIDNDIEFVFTNQEAKIEQAKIDVLNASGRSGLAGSRSRWLGNRGLRVVVAGNYDKDLQTNQIYVEDLDKYKWTIYEIQNTLRGNVEIINQKFPGRVVGDMVLVLGSNEVKD